MRQQVEKYILALQDQIVSSFESLDPTLPLQTRLRPILVFAAPPSDDAAAAASETILEKAGVNISLDSLVIHPRNPNAPTVHANYRYFEITEAASSDSDAEPKLLAWWFGGGCDLTPSYLFEEDAVHFHNTLKTTCDALGTVLFPAFKKWCTHLRLDDSEKRPRTPADIFAFVQALGNSHGMPYTPLQRRWQLIRRGRYFGLMTPGARIESILMSLPEVARWEYMTELGAEGTEEGKLMVVLKTPKEWV
ncbi:Coproporphyrinogen III oxidase [Mycena sp. CBHHK59/15]|nr:Coproporphyrinogen III oxidase [Mycena sp. CBHHK59/15]